MQNGIGPCENGVDAYVGILSVANEGADWVVTIDEVGKGNYYALAAMLPIVTGGSIKVVSKTGSLVDTLKATKGIPFITPGSLPIHEAAALRATMAHIDAGTKPTGALAKKWGKQFKNWKNDLPGGCGAGSPFKEYRVAPGAGETGAGTRRVVVNTKTGEIYYTWTHYGDTGNPPFVRIR